jgi:hypothetical protein
LKIPKFCKNIIGKRMKKEEEIPVPKKEVLILAILLRGRHCEQPKVAWQSHFNYAKQFFMSNFSLKELLTFFGIPLL